MTMIKRTKVLSCSLDPHIRSVSLCNELLELRVRQIEANLCQLGWGWRFLCFVHWSNAPDQIDWVKITGACGLSGNGCNKLFEYRVKQLVANQLIRVTILLLLSTCQILLKRSKYMGDKRCKSVNWQFVQFPWSLLSTFRFTNALFSS